MYRFAAKLDVMDALIEAPVSFKNDAEVKLFPVVYPTFATDRVPVPPPPYSALVQSILP